MSDSDSDDFFKASSSSEDEEELRKNIGDYIYGATVNAENEKDSNDKSDEYSNDNNSGDSEIANNNDKDVQVGVSLSSQNSNTNNYKRKADTNDSNMENSRNSRTKRARTRANQKDPIRNENLLSISDDDISLTASSQVTPKTQPDEYSESESEDENDLFFKSIIKAKSASPESKDNIPNYTNDEKNNTKTPQPKRVYNIRFRSKLDGSINKSVIVKVLGKFTFEKILPSALQGLMKAYKIPAVMKKIYHVDNVTLYWDSAKVLNFMTCNSLNIKQSFENEISSVDITIVSKAMEKEMEESLRTQAFDTNELSKQSNKTDTNTKLEEDYKETRNDAIFDEFEKELEAANLPDMDSSSENITIDGPEGTPTTNNSDEEGEIIKIVLADHDKMKFPVNVRGTTVLSKITEYYRKQKKLPQNVKIELLFDNDVLELAKNITDYEIEDEDLLDIRVVD
ncbi:Protein esc2 [Maudiozyma exigua]|uniref:Protein esc2 n=1 Tax=Maudiozyma exigua TaxID=34358 RepID=A0A9P7B8G2_MAUEX|nr:Protein esc2 [Kazachstania exigua]